jgi:adenosylcobinamide-GDP ribazoletransferase
MSWASAWRLAVGTLTVVPVRPPGQLDRTVAGRAMVLAPLAVLPLAVLAATLGRLAGATAWPDPLPGLVVVAALAVGTGALHLDGLADTVDGLGSGQDGDRALAIMRRGDVGPMGVVALVLVLAAQAIAATTLTGSWPEAALLAVLIAASRASLVIACRPGVPAGRPGGLGSAVAGAVRTPVAILAGGASALLVVTGAVAGGRPWWSGVVAAMAAALLAYGVVRLAVRRLGGITGDVLGAVVELSLTALLLAVAASSGADAGVTGR